MLSSVTRDTETVLRLLNALAQERDQAPEHAAGEARLLTALDEAGFDLFAALARRPDGD